jgi:hypothetical protein
MQEERKRMSKKHDPELVAEFDRMVRRRPLRPPPMPRHTAPTRTAGALALERDRRLGLICDGIKWERRE